MTDIERQYALWEVIDKFDERLKHSAMYAIC
jgi:hypothetical protein